MLNKFKGLFGFVAVIVSAALLGAKPVSASIGYDGKFENFNSLQIADYTTKYGKGERVGVIFDGNKEAFKKVYLTMVSRESGDSFEVLLDENFTSFIVPDTVRENETYEMNDISLYLNVSGNVVEFYSAKENGSHTYMNPGEHNKITIKGQENLYANISFSKKVVKLSENITVNGSYGTDVKSISLVMKNLTNGKTYSVPVKENEYSHYISLSGKTAGEYVLKAINVTGNYSSNQIILNDDYMRIIVENGSVTAQSLVNKENTKTVKVFEFTTNYESAGDRAYINLVSNIKIKSAKVTLSDGKNTYSLTIKSVNKNPYVVIPTTFKTQRYVPTKLTIVDTNSKKYTIKLGSTWLTDTYTKVNGL